MGRPTRLREEDLSQLLSSVLWKSSLSMYDHYTPILMPSELAGEKKHDANVAIYF